jgi:hypothetical protein
MVSFAPSVTCAATPVNAKPDAGCATFRYALPVRGDATGTWISVRISRRGEQVNKEVSRIHQPFATTMDEFDLCPKRQDGSRPVCRRVGMRNASPNSAAIAHLHVTNGCGSLCQEWAALPNEGRRLKRIMGGAGTDDECAVLFAYATQFGDAPNINEQRRIREPQLHHRDQTVSASENLRIVGTAGEQTHRLCQTRRALIVKRARNHDIVLLR